MTLSYPLGLLGLIAIPILILIFLIKNRYTEQTISSTYIWTVSERFLKRRVPLSILAGLISLLLQILLVVFISFAIAQPVFVLKESAKSYCFVLDASGSMNYVQNGETRFDLAKKEVTDLIDDATLGSEYTLIYVGDTTEIIFKHETDKKTAKQIISETSVGYVASEMDDALKAAQEFFNDNPSVEVYLFTDKDYVMHDNVKLINVADAVTNFAITNVTYGLSGGKLKINGTAVCYTGSELVEVNLYFDESEEIASSTPVLADEAGKEFEIISNRDSFVSFKLAIAERDALALDSEIVVYDVNYENISDVLLVSNMPYFIEASLKSAGITSMKIVSTEGFEESSAYTSGYGLYIFDGYMPAAMPDDGAVWFFNPQGSLAGSNFSYQSQIENPREAAVYSEPNSTILETLLKGTTGREFKLAKYIKCGLNGKFTTLVTCEGNPLVFAGSNVYGNREVVFAFDVRDSATFTLYADFSTLVKNLIDYSFPTIIEETSYYSGDIMQVNIVAGVTSVRIVTPSGKIIYPDTSVAVCEYQLTEVGVYSIILVMKDKSERIVKAYSSMPELEREIYAMDDDFSIIGVPEKSDLDGYYDPLLIIFIVLAVLAIADYGVYCYEQYQLR